MNREVIIVSSVDAFIDVSRHVDSGLLDLLRQSANIADLLVAF